MKIIKRDNQTQSFDRLKIHQAVVKACKAVYPISPKATEQQVLKQNTLNIRLATDVMEEVMRHVEKMTDSVKISTIQKLVENALMKENVRVARAYIEYRSARDRARDTDSILNKAITGLMNKTDKDTLNENANKDTRVFPTQRDLLAGLVSKHFARNYILPKRVVDAHDNGLLHYHDLDYAPFLPMSNCCLVDLKGMLENGFKLGNACIQTPNSIGVACAVMAQITAQVASHQYGGTTFANIDKVLAPYARKSYMKNIDKAVKYGIEDAIKFAMQETEKEIYDAFQAYEYEVNSLYTSCGGK